MFDELNTFALQEFLRSFNYNGYSELLGAIEYNKISGFGKPKDQFTIYLSGRVFITTRISYHSVNSYAPDNFQDVLNIYQEWRNKINV